MGDEGLSDVRRECEFYVKVREDKKILILRRFWRINSQKKLNFIKWISHNWFILYLFKRNIENYCNGGSRLCRLPM